MQTKMRIKLTVAFLYFLQTSGEFTYSYVGCFKDKADARALSGSRTNFYTGLTPQTCVTACGQQGYRYAGLQKSVECYCGNSGYDRYGHSKSCYYPCSGDFLQFCGGQSRNSVYSIVEVHQTSVTTTSSTTTQATTTPTTSTTTTTAPTTTDSTPTTTITTSTSTTTTPPVMTSAITTSTSNAPNTSKQTTTILTYETTPATQDSNWTTTSIPAANTSTTSEHTLPEIANTPSKTKSQKITGIIIGCGFGTVAVCLLIILVFVLVTHQCTRNSAWRNRAHGMPLYESIHDMNIGFHGTGRSDGAASAADTDTNGSYTDVPQRAVAANEAAGDASSGNNSYEDPALSAGHAAHSNIEYIYFDDSTGPAILTDEGTSQEEPPNVASEANPQADMVDQYLYMKRPSPPVYITGASTASVASRASSFNGNEVSI